ncbi:MAG: hypothetical protein ACKO4R_12805, partial [Synechococcales cyanobacterium]
VAIFDGTTPYRSSDHDPVIVGLNLVSSVNEPPLIISGTPGPDNLKAGVNFAGVNQIIFTGAGSDMVDIPIGGAKPNLGSNSIFTGSGADTISVADGDRAFGGSGDDEFDATEATGYRISGGVGNDIFYLGVNGR